MYARRAQRRCRLYFRAVCGPPAAFMERIILAEGRDAAMVLYAKDIVEKDFLSLSASSSVLEGARAMKNSRHGFAIIGTPEEPQGVVTEWDIIYKVVSEGRDPRM